MSCFLSSPCIPHLLLPHALGRSLLHQVLFLGLQSSLQRWGIVSKNQASQTELISPHAGNGKRQLVSMCQLWKRASLLCCSVGNLDLDAKHDPKPGLLHPVIAGGTMLWFSLCFISKSSLLALPTSGTSAEIQPLPTKVFLRYLSPAAYTGTSGGYGPPVEDHCSNWSVSA